MQPAFPFGFIRWQVKVLLFQQIDDVFSMQKVFVCEIMEYLLKPGDLYFRDVVPVFLFSSNEFLLPAPYRREYSLIAPMLCLFRSFLVSFMNVFIRCCSSGESSSVSALAG